MAAEGSMGRLVEMCIDAASSSADSVESWRRQRRTLERLPAPLADALVRRLNLRRLLYPSLLEVFQDTVEEINLKGESHVDAEWMAYLGAFRYLRSLNIADCRGINNSALWPLAGMSSLIELDLSRCSRINDDGIKHLFSIPKLEKLCISETGVTANGLMLISSLKNARVLDLGGIPVNDMVLYSLQVLTQLEYLDLWGSKISDDGAAILGNLPRLSFVNLAWTNVTKLPIMPSVTCLNMSNCTIKNIVYGQMKASGSLEKLFVPGASFIDVDEAFSNVETSHMTVLDMSGCNICDFHILVNMKVLEHLDISSCKLTDNSIEHVAAVGANLRFLSLSNTSITLQGICLLAGHAANLEKLYLSRTAVDDAALSYISMMPSLRVLDLSYTKIKGFTYSGRETSERRSSLSELWNLVHLESLNLEETQVRDEALEPLASLKELKCLYLKSDFLSDVSLHALSSMPRLESLGFRGAVLTNSGLLLYIPSSTLRTLDLRGCWLLTEDVLISFCKSYHRIEVRHEDMKIPNAERNEVGPSYSSSSVRGSLKASGSNAKGVRSTRAPSSFQKPNFADERIKYSRDELLRLQLSPLPVLPLHDQDVLLPEFLRKE